MAQKASWEKEYCNSLFVTKGEKPQNDVLRFLRWVKKERNAELENLKVLDLGSGTGRNAIYLAQLGNEVVGMEISPTAVRLSGERAGEKKLKIEFLEQSIGTPFSFEDNEFDLLLDVTASNALNEKERAVYLTETSRVLKKEGYFFVRALCKDGDKNAKKLLAGFPGKEQDTYVMPETDLVERVFSEADFRAIYGQYFKILKLLKKSSYAKFKDQSYKRNYWLAYLGKKA